MKNIFYLFFFLLCSTAYSQKNLRDSVKISNEVFKVIYSEKLEQPLILKYRSTNRPTKVNRGTMDFYSEKEVHTSDNEDYKNNVFDKGHLAPAATFSDDMKNLKQTFSYLNSALQNQYLNRGEWRLLEEQERKWDDNQPLTVIISVNFDKTPKVLPSGASVPSGFEKHILFESSKQWKCFFFTNEQQKSGWENNEIKCNSPKHKF